MKTSTLFKIALAAALLFAGVGLGVLLLTAAFLQRRGQLLFFERGDARMYWYTGRDLFGGGNGFGISMNAERA